MLISVKLVLKFIFLRCLVSSMPRRCSVFGCNGNYDGTPYVISFPKDEVERERWIVAMPNEKASLERLNEIYVCESHFDCEWVSVKGGKRPKEPPSIFQEYLSVSSSKAIRDKDLHHILSAPQGTGGREDPGSKIFLLF